MKRKDLVDWDDFEKELFKKPGFKEAVEETRLEFEIAYALIKARIEKGLTQAEIAIKMETKQSVISRLENAKTTPSLSFLKRLAKVLGASLQVQFKFNPA